ncbi:MAG: peptidase S8/S53 subtilisin kexin sedolisin [Chlorobi bacterium OLB4]|nr:MAG: peptidase S8/S53 subtilisin kexin sedolisin [Chlorobi bacterium OLB4]
MNQSQQAGTYKVSFNANNLSSGVYFYKLTAGSFSAVKKMVLIK